jgi:hypothetical protein
MTRVRGALSALFLLCSALEAQAQNLVQNPGFTSDLSNWTIVPGGTYTVAWDGAMGSIAPGSASLDLASGPTDVFLLHQCVPAVASTLYTVGGSFRYPSGLTTVPVGGLVVQYYSDPSCTTPIGGLDGFGLSSSGTPADTWVTATYAPGLTTPVGAVAARINLRFSTFAAGAAHGWYDDIRFSVTPLNYYAVPPCRLVDTRGGAPIGGPVLQGQETRTFAVAGICGLPSTARALSLNLTVTQPSAPGFVRLLAPGLPVPTTSSINYVAGQTRANNAIVSLNTSAALAAFAGQPVGTTVHLILDVNGYFQ